MKILFLTDNFPPEGNAPATRTFEHATQWIKQGHQVTVITCAPNFPEGKVFDGYQNNWYSKTVMNGINVIRVKTFITANEGFVKRILDYMSFMVSSFIAGLFEKSDVIVGTSPQFFTVVSARFLALVKRRPFIFELRDIWPASITAVGAMRKSKVINLLEKLELYLYHKSSRIVAVTNSFKKELTERGVDPEKIVVVRNGVDLKKYKPAVGKNSELEIKYNLKGKFVVGYIGTHGMAHALESVLDTAKLFQDQNNDNIRFVFAGGGAARNGLIDKAKKLHLKNVVFLDRVPKEEVASIWSLCDLSLANLKDAELFRSVIPSKIFESMAMGLPLVMAMPLGEATSIIEEYDCGYVCKPESPDSLYEVVDKAFHDRDEYLSKSRNALEASRFFSREKLSMDMLRCFEETARRV